MQKVTYEKDEHGMIIASIPGYQGLYSQGDTYEEARENLLDAVQSVLMHKLITGDKKIIQDIEKFSQKNMKHSVSKRVSYA